MVSASFKKSGDDIGKRQREILKASRARSKALYKKAEALGFKRGKGSDDRNRKKDT
ncbi:hypothetical protein [Lacicoccus alkaliphilus]|uniref:hypothetical protein n=1 Tax=Lacicoccus alkaliphilus TaxID=148453 RepID=UPI0015BE058D|nr:hypothetical protein [Salinicoccus alkaliphilus]